MKGAYLDVDDCPEVGGLRRHEGPSSHEPAYSKVEVRVGEYGLGGRFIGEIVRFRGLALSTYPDPNALQELGRRRAALCTLYRCPSGYRVYREEIPFYPEKRRYKYGRRKEGHAASLLPVGARTGDEGAPEYGLYTEEEARRSFPWLFSALGTPNIRDLD